MMIQAPPTRVLSQKVAVVSPDDACQHLHNTLHRLRSKGLMQPNSI